MDDTRTDEELAAVVAARDSSDEAMTQGVADFETLYRRHSRLVLAFLSSRTTRNQLEDLHQIVWQKVWQHLPCQFKGGNFRA